jgi:hypothetical protein
LYDGTDLTVDRFFPGIQARHAMSTETRLIDLEARIAHQDQAISDLSKEVYLQQKQIEQIEANRHKEKGII